MKNSLGGCSGSFIVTWWQKENKMTVKDEHKWTRQSLPCARKSISVRLRLRVCKHALIFYTEQKDLIDYICFLFFQRHNIASGLKWNFLPCYKHEAKCWCWLFEKHSSGTNQGPHKPNMHTNKCEWMSDICIKLHQKAVKANFSSCSALDLKAVHSLK